MGSEMCIRDRPQSLLSHTLEEFKVHPIALHCLSVQTGDEIESGQQLGKSPLSALPAVLVDQPDCGPELLWVAVQPVLLVHGGIGLLQPEREHRTVGEGLDESLRDLGGRLEALGDNRGVGIVDMEDRQPLVLARAM